MKFRHRFRISTGGQSLVEVVVALAVVVVLAISLVTASLLTQRTSRSATSNTQATKLVEENIEQIRVFRDRKGFSALNNGGCWVLVTTNPDPSNWTLSNSSCPEPKILGGITFNRSMSIAGGANANQKVVIVIVTWTDSTGQQTVSNTTVLSNCVSTTTSC